MRISRERISNIFFLIACFIITISYSTITGNYDSWNNIKFVGFILILLALVFGESTGGESGIRLHIRSKYLFLAMYFVAFTVASVATQDLSITGSIMALFYTGVLLMYVFRGYVILKNPKSYFYGAVGILAGVVLVLYLSRSTLLIQWMIARNGRIRVFGLFSHPNIYASILFSIVLLLDIGIRKNKLRKRKKAFWVLVILVAILLIYYTNSRTTMIMVVVYFGITYFFLLRDRVNKRNRWVFVVFIVVVSIIIAYLFVSEYVLQQETFYTRIDDYQDLSLKGVEVLFGHSFSSSTEGRSFEVSIYTMLYRIGVAGLLGYVMLLAMFISSCNNQKKNYIAWSCVITLAVSALAEAYIMNITHLFSCIIYLLISSEVMAPGRINSHESIQR